MRRILAISIAAAIPAVVPVHAADAYTKPAPPPAASGHSRPAHRVHSKHAIHSRSAPMGETRDRPTRPENDVQVDADDGGGSPQAPAGAPEHATAGAHGATGAHGRSSRPTRSRPASRPGTGADSGFADADDPALPPEAAAALQEAAELQGSAHGAAGNSAPTANAPSDTAPSNTAPSNTAPNAAPGATAPNATAPRGPGRAAGRPARPITDQSTNQTSSRKAGRKGRVAAMPMTFYSNTTPVPQSSRLVLRTSAGNGPERTVTLQCDPPGGTHPKAAQACADVAKAGGQLAQMPAGTNPRACFMIYAPVTVTARGDWQGQAVRFTEKFPNTCVMRDKTGSVFDF
jgi:hypothetical protein